MKPAYWVQSTEAGDVILAFYNTATAITGKTTKTVQYSIKYVIGCMSYRNTSIKCSIKYVVTQLVQYSIKYVIGCMSHRNTGIKYSIKYVVTVCTSYPNSPPNCEYCNSSVIVASCCALLPVMAHVRELSSPFLPAPVQGTALLVCFVVGRI